MSRNSWGAPKPGGKGLPDCSNAENRNLKDTDFVDAVLLKVLLDKYFVNCNWVDTRWQQYSTHLQTNSTQINTMEQNTQNGTYVTIKIHNL